jgi:hypothetical protein
VRELDITKPERILARACVQTMRCYGREWLSD